MNIQARPPRYEPRLAQDQGPATPLTAFCNKVFQISFLHPFYPDKDNVFLRLHALDHENGGLHAGTALIACGILAGNRWDGKLAERRSGLVLDLDSDDLLTKDAYYFHLPPTGDGRTPPTENVDALLAPEPWDYPVFLSFDDWEFPHGNLPSSWMNMPLSSQLPPGLALAFSNASSNASSVVRIRDQYCQVTRFQDYLDSAHLVPVKLDYWYRANHMGDYVTGNPLGEAFGKAANLILLRPDIHQCFDQLDFVFAPKGDNCVVHFLSVTRLLGRLYHSTSVGALHAGREFLFARFALGIFRYAEFPNRIQPRNFIVIEQDSKSLQYTWTTKKLEPPSSRNHSSRSSPSVSTARSQNSPSKRGRTRMMDDYLLPFHTAKLIQDWSNEVSHHAYIDSSPVELLEENEWV